MGDRQDARARDLGSVSKAGFTSLTKSDGQQDAAQSRLTPKPCVDNSIPDTGARKKKVRARVNRNKAKFKVK
jgi:hypothetical protein